MKRNTIYILLSTMVYLLSCKSNENKEIEKASVAISALEKTSLLLGEWEGRMDGVEVTEIWKRENEKMFVGKSFSLKNKDTLSSENIVLEQQGDTVFYIPKVKNQNQGQIVKFALTSSTDHLLTFENPMHDFPQKITYQLINNDSLVAEISGLYKGQMQSEKFPMHRKH